jgi:hypothetical protein
MQFFVVISIFTDKARGSLAYSSGFQPYSEPLEYPEKHCHGQGQ